MEGAGWLILMGGMLVLNMLLTIMLCVRSGSQVPVVTETAPAPNLEALIRIQKLETALSKCQLDLARQQAIIARVQSQSDSVQMQVARIPPPNVPAHGVLPQPPVEPAPEATTQQ